MMASHCFKVQGGIIVPVFSQELPDVQKLKNEDISLSFGDYGICVVIKDMEIPIPEMMIDYFTGNRVITVYSIEPAQYVCEAVLSVEIPKESLMETIGAYRYWKKTNKEQGTT